MSDLYIYGSNDHIETYQGLHKASNESVIELVGRMVYEVEAQIGYTDHRATYEMVVTLSERLGIRDKVKPYDEVFDENGRYRHYGKKS